MRKSAHKGFTLVELLVVIAIIAILAAVVALIINPLEIMRRGRDATRLSDLQNLQSAINVAVQEATESASLILCADPADPAPCEGRSHTGTRSSAGTGWVKVNLSNQQAVSVPTLSVDPNNNATYHYTYCSDGNAWEINTVLESDAHRAKMANDGGNENNTDTTGRFEVGSNLTLVSATGGTCTY